MTAGVAAAPTRQPRRRGHATAGIWAAITACCAIGVAPGTASAEPGTPALVDDGGSCGPWVSPNIGNPLGVLVGEAVHRAICDAARQQSPAPPPAGEPAAAAVDAP